MISKLSHGIISGVIVLAFGLTLGQWLLPALFMASFYIGREITAAEYRWIEHYGEGLRANMPWHGPFQPKVWNFDNMLDWILPVLILAAVIVA